MGNRDSVFNRHTKISHAPCPKAEAVIGKEPALDWLAGLCEPPRELGVGGNFGDIDVGSSHFESSFYHENAIAKCHFGVLLVDY